MLKRIIRLILIAIIIPFWNAPFTNAQTGKSSFTLISPVNQQSYQPGDTIEIKWSSDISPALYYGVTVNLLTRSSNRYRIGYLTKQKTNGLYLIKWKIPENFFEKKKIKSDSAEFKIEIKTEGNSQLRFISSLFLIKIQKIVSGETSHTINNASDSTIPDIKLPDNSQLIAHYNFKAYLEPWVIKRLTVLNDTQNDGFDPDPTEISDVIDKVFIRYPDESGSVKVASAPFVDGKALFSGIDFYIPKNNTASLDLYVNTIDPKVFGEKFSGKTFRIGIQDVSNNLSTFEAVSQITDTAINSLSSFQVTSSLIQEFVVKENALNIKVLSPITQSIYNGENNLFEFTISSKSASIGRLVFDVTQIGLTSLDTVRVYRNNTLLAPGDSTQDGDMYLVWDSGPASCFAHLSQNGAGTGMDCNGNTASSGKLILSFSNEETVISANTYKLVFNVNGVSSGDIVSIRLNSNDDQSKPIIAGSDTVNGKIYNGGSGLELFTNSTDFISEATTITNRNIIWSDNSADFHKYTTITPSLSPSIDTGSSADWSNGYLLKVNALPDATSAR